MVTEAEWDKVMAVEAVLLIIDCFIFNATNQIFSRLSFD